MSTADDSLYWACFYGSDKRRILVLANQNNANYVRPHIGDTPLHQACKQGWLDIVVVLIQKYGCVPSMVSKSGESPLHYACQYGHIDVVKLLIEKYDCNPHVVTVDGESLLHCACLCGHIDIVTLLIEKYGCDLNVLTKKNEGLLHCACRCGNIDIVKLLIETYGYNPNVMTKSNQSLLHYACHFGNVGIIEYLIRKHHLNPLMRDNDQLEPLDYAVNNDQYYTAVYICQHCISSDEMLSPNRIKTTINLIKYISKRANTYSNEWKTTVWDNILQLVGSSRTYISHITSAVVSEILKINRHIANYIIAYFKPDLKTADGDTILQLVCQSETLVSHISSVVMMKWLSDSTDLKEIDTLKGITADGHTLFELVCQSEKCLTQISSTVFMKWLRKTVLRSVTKAIPDCKTADGHTLLQLTLQSEMSISRISSGMLVKLLSNSREITVNEMKNINPNLTMIDGSHFPHVLCLSNIENNKVTELMQHYIMENGWNPDTCDGKGNTVLHIACQTDKFALVSYLINQAQCNPNVENYDGSLPVDMSTKLKLINYLCQHDQVTVSSRTIIKWLEETFLIDSTRMYILQSLVDNHKTITKDGSTLLHVVCTSIFRSQKLVDFLLTECKCDPNCIDSNRQTPLQSTLDLRTMKILVQHGAKMTTDIVFNVISSVQITESSAVKLLALSSIKGTMLWHPTDVNRNGETALDHAYTLNKQVVVNYLLTEAKYDSKANYLLRSLLRLTTNLNVAKLLIQHGAKATPDLVLRFEAMENKLNKHSLIKLLLTTWNPDDRDSDGYTALHLACKADQPDTVNLLLSVAHCDPNVKSSSAEVPLQMTTNQEIIKDLIRHGAKTSIMYKTYKKTLGTNKPLQPPVKIFIVGNPLVGKSTLTAALKTEKWIISQFFSSGKVSDSEVDEKTVGIVPHDYESRHFGRVTLYDFAGHREFYSGHAALLQTAIQSTPPIFLLVVNLSEDDNEIIRSILYWISFLENQCASVTCRPHIILVGSHADALKGVNPKDKVETIITTLDKKCFTNMEYIGFVAMNCQFHESTGMSDLRHLLIKSCQELRIHEPITFSAHCFLIYLIDNLINVTGITIRTVSAMINNRQLISNEGLLIQELLPTNFDGLYKVCLELNDRGHILLLKDRTAVENSYIVIDKEFLLSKISGTVFAPEGFEQYKDLSSNTGVVPLSKIVHYFPESDTDILIAFFTHLEFCHEILDQDLLKQIAKDHSQALNSNERYYLFPGLISLEAESDVWETEIDFNLHFGWTLQCTNLEQFLTSRFLQVLLLRLAFSLALESKCDSGDVIGIHRKCSIWKNGIFWGRQFGMETLVEVIEDKSVVVICRFQTLNLEKCLKHRSEVIRTILECHNRFCPRVSVAESFIDASSPLRYPFDIHSGNRFCTVYDLSQALVSNCESPSVVLSGSGKAVPAERFLSFEPYAEIESLILQELWDENSENKTISDNFLLKYARKAMGGLSYLIKMVSESSTDSKSENQLYQHLRRWRDSDKTNKKTYEQLRQTVDQYSVFAGRNVLELAGKQLKLPKAATVEEEEEKQQCKLKPHGNAPKLRELQLLKLPNGTELRIMREVAPEWDEVAVALGFDGARIKTLKMGAHYQPREACLEMFTEWLDGGHDLQPPTWDVLIHSLTAANLTEIADLLSSTIEIEAEDVNDSTSSIVVVDIESQEKSSIAVSDMKIKAESSSKCDKKESHKVDWNMDGKPAGAPHIEQGCGISTTLNVKALEELEGRGRRKVRVVESIGSEWEEVAKALDMGQEDIDMIKTRHSDHDEEACREMLATWLEGSNGEISWTALNQALIDAGLPELADSVQDIL